MQTVKVSPFGAQDYVHSEETLQVEHLATKASYELFVKDMDTPQSSEGRVAIVIPVDLLDDISIDDTYISVVVSGKHSKTIEAHLGTLSKVLRALHEGKQVSIT